MLQSLRVISYMRVISQCNSIEKWIEVINTGKKDPISIGNLQSASINLPRDSYELNQISGYWGHEYQPQVTPLTPGVMTLQVKDFKSYGVSAFLVGKENTIQDTAGHVWFGALQQSGNWRLDFDTLAEGDLQTVGWINFWDTRLNLQLPDHF